MGDITDITIGSVFRWKKEGNPPSKDGKIKNSYFIFLGCYEEESEYYLILFRATARTSFYTDGDRSHHSYIIFENHPCFERKSATSEIDIHYKVNANRLYDAFNSQYIEKLCILEEDKISKLKDIFINSDEIPPIIRNKKIMDWLEYLISTV